MMTAESDVAAIVSGDHGDPFAVLGPHRVERGGQTGIAIRAFQPSTDRLVVIPDDNRLSRQAMRRLHPEGFYEANYWGHELPFRYRLEVHEASGPSRLEEDVYRFGPLLTEFDLYLSGEGRHYEIHRKLGAHPTEIDGVQGVAFAVWAPNARRVSVVGDFNRWDGRVHPMRFHQPNGIWEIFLPGVPIGARYKYEIKSASGSVLALKADPITFAFEEEVPRTASVVTDLSYEWGDAEWMASRASKNALNAPIAFYEVHLGSWMRVPEEGNRFLTYLELAERLGEYVKRMGYTHVELLPIMEHPFYGSWGYQPIGLFAPTRRYGTPVEFKAFVDRLHERGIGVVLDWVPAHFPRDPHGLVYFDGTHLYEHQDPRLGEHRDWGTLIYNFGRREVANYLLTNALFWLEEYHLDGLRVDAVASMLYLDYSRQPGDWIPNRYGGNQNLEAIDFLRRFNEVVYERCPGVMTIAEESTAWPSVSRPVYLGGLGFGFKWNMGWMHDVLIYLGKDPIYRKYHLNTLTFSLVYAWHENFVLPLSHDEVVHLKGSLHQKMPGDDWQKFAALRTLFAYMYGHPGKKLLFMGGEFGQTREWRHDESLDWHLPEAGPYHRGLQRLVRDLNVLYRTDRALHEVDFDPAGFEWIDCNDWEQSVVSFVRRARDPEDFLVFVCNLTPVVRHGYRIGAPQAGFYRELINTDSATYGGSNVGNLGGVMSEPIPAHGRADSIVLTLPPLATLVLRRQPRR